VTDRRADRQTNGQTESLYQYDARQTLGSVELKDVKLLDSDTYLDSCYVSVKDNINRKVYSAVPFHCSVIVFLFFILFLFSFSMLHVLWLKVYCVICISVI